MEPATRKAPEERLAKNNDPELVHSACPDCMVLLPEPRALCGVRIVPNVGGRAGVRTSAAYLDCVVCDDLTDQPCVTCGGLLKRPSR